MSLQAEERERESTRDRWRAVREGEREREQREKRGERGRRGGRVRSVVKTMKETERRGKWKEGEGGVRETDRERNTGKKTKREVNREGQIDRKEKKDNKQGCGEVEIVRETHRRR